MKASILTVTLLVVISSLSLADIGSYIPMSRRAIWNNAGYVNSSNLKSNIPRNVNIIKNVKQFGVVGNGITDDAPTINDLIQASNSGEGLVVLYFPTGTYRCSDKILVNKNNIVIVGDGAGTEFCFDGSSTGSGASRIIHGGFVITGIIGGAGGEENQSATMASSYSINASGVPTSSGYLEIRIPNGIWQDDDDPSPDASVGQIVKVTPSSSPISTYDPVDLTFGYASQAGGAVVNSLNPVQNVGIENIKITSTGVFDDHILITKAANCWVSGIVSYNPWWNHIQIGHSTNIEVRGCYFDEARNVDEGGHGYGVYIGGHSTNCLVEDNIFQHLRHSMILFGGANRNVLGYNYSGNRKAMNSGVQQNGVEPDILFHARLPYANLVEGNVCDYIGAENEHGMNGDYNTIFRNKIMSVDQWPSLARGGIRINLFTKNSFPLYGAYDDPKFNIVGNALNNPDNINYVPYKNAGILDWRNGRYTYPNSDTPFDETSYYYPSKPAFLGTTSTWPLMGVKTSTGVPLTQTNPAEERWGTSGVPKTKSLHSLITCTVPDDFPTISSALASAISGQTVVVNGTQALSSETVVPTGVTLCFSSTSVLQMNGYILFQGNGKIIIEPGASGIAANLLDGTNLIGCFPSAQLAINSACPVKSFFVCKII